MAPPSEVIYGTTPVQAGEFIEVPESEIRDLEAAGWTHEPEPKTEPKPKPIKDPNVKLRKKEKGGKKK